MPGDYHLKVDGIKGEATDEKNKDSIDVESFSFGATQGGGQFGAGHGEGKVQFSDISFVSKTNKASPILLIKCATGEHIKEAILTCRKAGGKQEEFFNVKMTDILVSSFQTNGSGGSTPLPMDSYSFNFSKIEVEYKPQDMKGALGTPSKAGYDLKLNKKT